MVLALALAAALTLVPSPAAADPAIESRTRRHAVFVEAMGRGGIWGLGYGLQLSPRFGVGAVVSASMPDGQRLMSFSPYLTAYPLGTHRHRWFVDVGPQLVHLVTPSPVPEWDGTSETGLGGQIATGYELRARVLIRVFGMVVAGENGVAPWLGADIGWTL
jgi:hypothetical protein